MDKVRRQTKRANRSLQDFLAVDENGVREATFYYVQKEKRDMPDKKEKRTVTVDGVIDVGVVLDVGEEDNRDGRVKQTTPTNSSRRKDVTMDTIYTIIPSATQSPTRSDSTTIPQRPESLRRSKPSRSVDGVLEHRSGNLSLNEKGEVRSTNEQETASFNTPNETRPRETTSV